MEIKQTLIQKTQLSPYELLCECRDEAMKKVVNMVNRCANGNSILVLGENGTGKEVVAHALHERGDRSRGPMVILDCTNLTGDTMKSELFGHEKGSFTGASDRRIGLFEKANGGTAFLDEIGEVPFDEQAKLLRVIQERSFCRMGSGDQIRSEFRLIAATNKDLPRMVKEGRFRQDLYYRLQMFTIAVPPLRSRMEDVIRLANHFVDQLSEGKKMLAAEAEGVLLKHCWLGNVRELKNAIERGVVFSGDNKFISVEDLALNPASLPAENFDSLPPVERHELILTHNMDELIETIRTIPREKFEKHGGLLTYIERSVIEASLRFNGENMLRTCRQLGIGRQTLYNMLKAYGIKRRLDDDPPPYSFE